MKAQKEYVDLNLSTLNYKEVIGYDGTIISGYIITDDAKVYHAEDDGRFTIINPYLNTYSNKYKWKNGYYKIRVNKKLYNLHWLLARAFVPGYKIGLVAHHIDHNSTHNFANNLEWTTRGQNVKEFWNSLTEEEMAEYKKNYSKGVKAAHEKGKYKKHLKELHNKGDIE